MNYLFEHDHNTAHDDDDGLDIYSKNFIGVLPSPEHTSMRVLDDAISCMAAMEDMLEILDTSHSTPLTKELVHITAEHVAISIGMDELDISTEKFFSKDTFDSVVAAVVTWFKARIAGIKKFVGDVKMYFTKQKTKMTKLKRVWMKLKKKPEVSGATMQVHADVLRNIHADTDVLDGLGRVEDKLKATVKLLDSVTSSDVANVTDYNAYLKERVQEISNVYKMEPLRATKSKNNGSRGAPTINNFTNVGFGMTIETSLTPGVRTQPISRTTVGTGTVKGQSVKNDVPVLSHSDISTAIDKLISIYNIDMKVNSKFISETIEAVKKEEKGIKTKKTRKKQATNKESQEIYVRKELIKLIEGLSTRIPRNMNTLLAVVSQFIISNVRHYDAKAKYKKIKQKK